MRNSVTCTALICITAILLGYGYLIATAIESDSQRMFTEQILRGKKLEAKEPAYKL